MKKFVSLLLCFSLFGNYVLAEEPKVHAIKKDEPSPFDGILYNYEADSTVHTTAEISEEICKKNNEFELKKKDTECEFQKKEITLKSEKDSQICSAAKDKLEQDKKELLAIIDKLPKDLPKQDNTLTVTLFTIGGVVLGATAGVLVTYYSMKR